MLSPTKVVECSLWSEAPSCVSLVILWLCYCRYFQNLVNTFEAKMELYRRQIEELESHLLANSPETGMSSQSELHTIPYSICTRPILGLSFSALYLVKLTTVLLFH